MREKCPNTSYFLSVFSRIWTEYGPEITPYLDTFRAVLFIFPNIRQLYLYFDTLI